MRVGRCAFVFGAALWTGIVGCRAAETPTPLAVVSKPIPAPAATPDARKRFGAPITPGATIALASVLEKPDDFASQTVTVEAKVRRNCTRRGCWMELADSLDPNVQGCRVTFKDYGFFVPLDSAGSTALVQGTVQVQPVSGPEVEHLESEGAKFPSKRADGTAREIRMVASGVELWRKPS